MLTLFPLESEHIIHSLLRGGTDALPSASSTSATAAAAHSSTTGHVPQPSEDKGRQVCDPLQFYVFFSRPSLY
jgi:hypothetical protein